MLDYRVYGGVLRSSLPLPELQSLPPGDRSADWTFLRGEPLALDGGAIVGRHAYAGDVTVTLREARGAWRVSVSDLGDFDLAPATAADGVRITWRPAADAREVWARFDLLGRVLPLALHRAGALVVHGSSVALHSESAVAFIAPKGHGKSTLALALAQRGGLLLSDDATVLQPQACGVRALPGVHAVRLWPDSADALDALAYGAPASLGRKLVVHDVPDALRGETAAPLRAVYVLEPAPATSPPAERERLGEVAASLALVRHAIAGGLLGGAEARQVLARAADVARRVPVYVLRVARDYARLDAAVRLVQAWHPAEAGRAARAARSA